MEITMEEIKQIDFEKALNIICNKSELKKEKAVKRKNQIVDASANHKKHIYSRAVLPKREWQKFINTNINLINQHKHHYNSIAAYPSDWLNENLFGELWGYVEVLKINQSQQHETKTEQETENDFTLSTIEDWLFQFKEHMSEADYKTLVTALVNRFDTGAFTELSKPIQINGRINKKWFGWALNKIFAAKGKRVEKELLMFAKKNISLFADVEFDENNILKSNLYKYFTTETK